MERAFISGRGLISPIGGTVAENEAGLRSGKSGIIQEPSFVEHKLESIVGGSAGPSRPVRSSTARRSVSAPPSASCPSLRFSKH